MTELELTGKRPAEYTAVALGIFDGLHLGHAAVIGKAVEIAEEKGIVPAVFTFKTATVTTKGDGYKPIYDDETKKRLIGELGAKYIFIPDFSDIRNFSPEEFAERILKGTFNAKYAVCGRDFRFGRGAACGTEELAEICRKNGIELLTVDDVTDGETGRKISSADIRRHIAEGRISDANRLMGHDYAVCGQVISGNRLGRTLDFPTANQLMPKNSVMPMFGVYASYAELDGKIYRGVTNIGVKPTVERDGVPLAETHFPNYSGDLYGSVLTVRLLEFVRREMKFEDTAHLKAQISRDTETILAMDYPFETENN